MKRKTGRFSLKEYLCFVLVLLAVFLLCICVGSVAVPLKDTLAVLGSGLTGQPLPPETDGAMILSVRIPRVLCAALVGAALSLCGAAMQGLLKNPLADGSTLGVSSGAGLGAVAAMVFGLALPGLPLAGTAVCAMIAAFASLLLILALAYRLDRSLSTNTIILVGVIFSMFASGLINVLITFAPERVRDITFWLMGSLQGADKKAVLVLACALIPFGTLILLHGRELNALAMGEENAATLGVNVKRVKVILLIAVSALIGVCVSVGGTIGFAGLIMPHMMRMLVGPNHRRLLPASLFAGAAFLMLADLAARTLFSPRELPIGVVTSLIGAVVFVLIFYSARKVR